MGEAASMYKDADRALKQHLLPRLRELGFKGSGRNFRRIAADRIDLVTIQFWKWGGAFCLNIAMCPPQGMPASTWRGAVSPDKVTAIDVDLDGRVRLTLDDTQGDCWFRYCVSDRFGPRQFLGTPPECAMAAANAMATRGENFYNSSPRWWVQTGTP